MLNVRKRFVLTVAVGLCGLLQVYACAAEDAEAQKREDFKKAYVSPDSGGRKKALDELRGSNQAKTWQVIYQVVQAEKDLPTWTHAVEIWCSGKALDPSLSQAIAQYFNLEKDRKRKGILAVAMAESEFKWAPLNVLCDFASRLRYPAFVADTTGTVEGQREAEATNGLVEQSRAYFEIYITAISKLSGQGFVAEGNSPGEIKTWWQQNNAIVLQKDLELKKTKALEAKKPKSPDAESK